MNTSSPLVTIVTIVKDDPFALERTARSLSDDPPNDVEWLVVDSSTDVARVDSILSLSKWETTRLWTKPAGVYNAMNVGLHESHGEYIWFLNAGDTLYSRDSLESAMAALTSRPVWAFGQVEFVDVYGRVSRPAPFDYEDEKRRWFARGRFPPHQGMICSTQILRELGGFNEVYEIAADYEVMLRLSQVGSPSVSEQTWAVFYEGGLSSREWRRALREFHQARRVVLPLTRSEHAGEFALTQVQYIVQSIGRVRRQIRE